MPRSMSRSGSSVPWRMAAAQPPFADPASRSAWNWRASRRNCAVNSARGRNDLSAPLDVRAKFDRAANAYAYADVRTVKRA